MSSAAQRQREWRRRQRAGQVSLRIAVNLDDLVCALIGTGALSPDAPADRAAIERALSEQLQDWAAAWRDRQA